jgi:hypothetical protein
MVRDIFATVLFLGLALVAGCHGGDDRQDDANGPARPPINHLAHSHPPPVKGTSRYPTPCSFRTQWRLACQQKRLVTL